MGYRLGDFGKKEYGRHCLVFWDAFLVVWDPLKNKCMTHLCFEASGKVWEAFRVTPGRVREELLIVWDAFGWPAPPP